MDRVQQLSILEAAAHLSPWELTALNLLERVSKKLFQQSRADRLYSAKPDHRRMMQKDYDSATLGVFRNELVDFVGGQSDYELAIVDAYEAMGKRGVLDGINRRSDVSNAKTGLFTYQRRHWFSPFGWKLAVHLYEVPTDDS